MKKLVTVILTMLLTVLLTVPVFAGTEESGSNLFILDNTITKEVSTKGDVYVMGNSVILNGNIGGDIISAANTIDIKVGEVGGNIRLAGATLNISAKSVRNITLAGGSINISSETKANGVYAVGSEIYFQGEAEEFKAVGEKIILNGKVTGNVNVDCDEFIIGENAEVLGQINVKASNKPIINGTFDESNIHFEQIKEITNNTNMLWSSLFSGIKSIISALIITVLLVLLCKNYFETTVANIKNSPWVPFVIGAATLIILPIAAIFVCLTVVGIPVAIISLLIYGVLIYLAPAIAGIILGKNILKNMNMYLSALVGTLIIKVILFVPSIGGMLSFICIMLSLGAFVQYIISIKQRGNKVTI